MKTKLDLHVAAHCLVLATLTCTDSMAIDEAVMTFAAEKGIVGKNYDMLWEIFTPLRQRYLILNKQLLPQPITPAETTKE